MGHLFFFLIMGLEVRFLLPTIVGCVAGSGLLLELTRRSAGPKAPRILFSLGFVVSMPLLCWGAFLGSLAAGFPHLGVRLPIGAVMTAGAAPALAAVLVLVIRSRCRRSIRTVMLMGSLFSCGMSLMVFSGMAVLVRPFMLAFDLASVLAVMGASAVLAAFAFWEIGDKGRSHRWAVGTGLLAAAMLLLATGSLGSILPFERWIEASSAREDLASEPTSTRPMSYG